MYFFRHVKAVEVIPILSEIQLVTLIECILLFYVLNFILFLSYYLKINQHNDIVTTYNGKPLWKKSNR